MAGRRERREDAEATRTSGLSVLEIDAIIHSVHFVVTARVEDIGRKKNAETKLDINLYRGSSALPIGAGLLTIWGCVGISKSLGQLACDAVILESRNTNELANVNLEPSVKSASAMTDSSPNQNELS